MKLCVAIALVVAGCHSSGAARLEGHWKGTRVDGVPPEGHAAATAFATQTEIDVHADQITVTTPKDKQTGRYRVVREEPTAVTIVTDRDGPDDAQRFTFEGDKTMKWTVGDGKTITFTRP